MARKKQTRRPGEGTVYKRKDGRFACEVTLEDHSRKVYYFKTEKEALDKQLEVRMQMAQGTLATGPQQTVKQFLEYWLEDVYKPSVRLKTYSNCHTIVHTHLIPGLGHFKLQKLAAQHVQSFYSKKMKGGTSASRIKGVHVALHTALEHARRLKLVTTNVCNDVQLPRQEEVEIQPLMPEQAKLLLQKVKEHRLEMLLTLALATGMREGELLALRWSDVDFQSGVLSVRRTVQHITHYGFVENEPKTAKGRRKIVLPQFVVEALTRHHVDQLKKRLEVGEVWNSRDLVFPAVKGGFQFASVLRGHFHKLLKEVGLPDVRFHDLRHSAATLLLSMGVPPKVVQELLGHSNISITMNIYSHVLPSMQKEAADKMNWFFDSSSS
jgi:integrase